MRPVLPADLRILLENEVSHLTRLSPVTIWRLERKGLFPRRVKLCAKRVGWVEREILAWIGARIAARAA
ncbi:prophage regulatory protein [Bradyrhizobium sp. S3.9.2]|uniref:helix-turn-helix transcriptional regulator n=1 Tax=unclassified Bradyrhizobium TaxID=2631580 RepID=UPI00339500B3